MSALFSFLPGPIDLLQILIVAAAIYYVLRCSRARAPSRCSPACSSSR
jgi:hypothetical protein